MTSRIAIARTPERARNLPQIMAELGFDESDQHSSPVSTSTNSSPRDLNPQALHSPAVSPLQRRIIAHGDGDAELLSQPSEACDGEAEDDVDARRRIGIGMRAPNSCPTSIRSDVAAMWSSDADVTGLMASAPLDASLAKPGEASLAYFKSHGNLRTGGGHATSQPSVAKVVSAKPVPKPERSKEKEEPSVFVSRSPSPETSTSHANDAFMRIGEPTPQTDDRWNPSVTSRLMVDRRAPTAASASAPRGQKPTVESAATRIPSSKSEFDELWRRIEERNSVSSVSADTRHPMSAQPGATLGHAAGHGLVKSSAASISDARANRAKPASERRVACRYGASCYRLNPEHLQTYWHPPKPVEVAARAGPIANSHAWSSRAELSDCLSQIRGNSPHRLQPKLEVSTGAAAATVDARSRGPSPFTGDRSARYFARGTAASPALTIGASPARAGGRASTLSGSSGSSSTRA